MQSTEFTILKIGSEIPKSKEIPAVAQAVSHNRFYPSTTAYKVLPLSTPISSTLTCEFHFLVSSTLKRTVHWEASK